MQIIDASWTPHVNMLHIQCSCGTVFAHRADRWVVLCVRCGRHASLSNLRRRFAHERGVE